jgi:tetratricopeptide (TPR) repeat protein
VLTLDSSYGKTDLFYAGYNDLLGQNYVAADSVFKLYQQKYPEDPYGWYLGGHAVEGIDTAQTGLAKPLYQKVIEIGDTTQDKASIKDKLIPSYRYMVAYYYNIKKQVDSAIIFNNKILELDPADATALQTKSALESVQKQQKSAADKASKQSATDNKK